MSISSSASATACAAVDVAAMHAGAADYLIKRELTAQILERAIRYTSERRRTMDALAEERALLARRVAECNAELSAANADLARAMRLKDEFLVSMSHELRTPRILAFRPVDNQAGQEYY